MGRPAMDHMEFINRLSLIANIRLVKGQKYDRYRKPLKFICPIGHEYTTTPQVVLTGNGCGICKIINQIERNKSNQLSIEQFNERLDKRNIKIPERQVFLVNEFKGRSIKAEFECSKKHKWVTYPNNILRGSGCPICKKKPYSRKAIEWIDSFGINIMHAENGGEYRIPDTNYFADGFDKSSNTIYEFHGDAYHGNPMLYNNNDRCHPFDSQLTAKTLYERTLIKERKIKKLGFNLITIWEYEWDERVKYNSSS